MENAAERTTSRKLSQLQVLEAEAIYILREVAAEVENPALMFSGGKDSTVLLHLAAKAFAPSAIPFPLLHIDTGHNFPEVLEFRDLCATRYKVNLIVGSVQDAIDRNMVFEDPDGTRNRIQTPVLLETAAKHGFNALMGGARRDEEKARAKERIFSFRDEFGQWDPKNQRPELWNIYNGLMHIGESMRVFPLSNWTELDVWDYIAAEGVSVSSLYYAHRREVFERDGMWFAVNKFCGPTKGEPTAVRSIRYRTVGDATLTAAVLSESDTVEKIVMEIQGTHVTERGATRGDDKFSEAAMEDRKKEGYF